MKAWLASLDYGTISVYLWILAFVSWALTGSWMIYCQWANLRDMDEAEEWRRKEYAKIDKEFEEVVCQQFVDIGGTYCGNCWDRLDQHAPQSDAKAE